MTTPTHEQDEHAEHVDAHPDEPGHAGSMSAGDHHDVADHGEDAGHDDHAHADGERLGPVDVLAWGAGALGVLLGLAVALCFAIATEALKLA